MARRDRDVVGGVDTHKHEHHAAVVDDVGRVLGSKAFPATTAGYRALLVWMRTLGRPVRVGVEGTSSYGMNLTRHLRAAGIEVVEVNRPNRQHRRRRGKSDPADAEAAARAALNGEAAGIPKDHDGRVESIRLLRVARRSAVSERTATINQIHHVIDASPEPLRAELARLSSTARLARCAKLRPAGALADPANAARQTLRLLGQRVAFLTMQVTTLDSQLAELVTAAAPAMLERVGVGVDTAGALLVAAGENADRLRSDGAFAAICGSSPVDASSGQQKRHRLNRGGNRTANGALWRIVLVRMTCHQPTKDYVARRTAEGKTKREIMRCLKRYVARELFPLLPQVTVQNP